MERQFLFHRLFKIKIKSNVSRKQKRAAKIQWKEKKMSTYLLRKTLRPSFLFSLASRQPQSFYYSSLISSSSSSSSSFSLLNKITRNPLRPSSFLPSRFASSGKQGGADHRLKRVLEAEIIHAEEADELEKGGELPKGFPFEIIDNPGEQTITLKREFSGENIQIEVQMPDLDEEEGGSDEDEAQDDKEDNPVDTNVLFVVKVAKDDDPYLEFSCTAHSDDIIIDDMLIKSQINLAEKIPYEGPKFSDLDEELQRALYKYLEVRGIDSSLTDFLRGYMINKDGREYLGWLKNMKDFIEK